jgi:heme/copper-type cytochrome/quinol oxidase subunit 1
MSPADVAPDAAIDARRTTGGGWVASADHRTVGTFCLAISLAFLLAGGVLAAALRTQLAQPDLHVLAPRAYRELLSLHGTFAVLLFLLPAWIGLGFAVVPLQAGSGRLAFPRLALFTAWTFLAGGVLLVVSALAWRGPVPGSWALDPSAFGAHRGGHAPELWLTGLALVTVAAVAGAANLLTTVVVLRAPGTTWSGTGLFSRSLVASSAVIAAAVPVLFAGLVLLYVQHHDAGRVFDAARGGDPGVWAHLFWFAVYPLLWALVLPALGAASDIFAAFSRRPVSRQQELWLAIAAVGVLAFAGWGSELVSDTTVPTGAAKVGGLLALAATGVVVLGWLDGLRQGRPVVRHPLAHALVLPPVLGLGLLGLAVMVIKGTGRAGHETYWWVASWHTVLVGGATVGLVAAVAYWAPSIWGRTLSGGLALLQLGVLALGAVLTVVPMFVLGFQRMPRGTVAYGSSAGWTAANLIATIGSYVLAAGVVLFAVNLLAVAARRTPPADAQPLRLADVRGAA